ncbi:MAG TPA: nitroreductase family protein [Hadesarchaea archaeon]|nr:nitroreductase family protein [Hadesarchaea archaeon]
MDVFEAIEGRRSVRSFKPDQIDEKDLEKILDAGRLSPSAGNCQPWEFVVIRDKTSKQKLVLAALGQSFVAEAPVVVVVCANIHRSSNRYGRRGAELYCIQDTAAAIQNMLLAAYALGYGTCWVGAFDEEAVARAIKAPPSIRPVGIIPIGKPAEKPRATPRLPLSKIVRENQF